MSARAIVLVAAASAAAMADSSSATAEPRVLAPERVTRLAGQATEVRPNSWEISMGDAVPAFTLANGPASVTSYNFVQLRGALVETSLVTRRPVEQSTSEFQDKHDLGDLFDLTDLGRALLQANPNKQACPIACSCSDHCPKAPHLLRRRACRLLRSMH